MTNQCSLAELTPQLDMWLDALRLETPAANITVSYN